MPYLDRSIEKTVLRALGHFPAVALTGPRQCGKSTLVKHLLEGIPDSVYLDLERPSDLRKLENAEWYLSAQGDRLVCIDEVQRMPDLFPLIRSLVDERDRPGRFLILGSASRDLLRQSSESLAGRISYQRLTPFLWNELGGAYPMERYAAVGAFPRSLLADDDEISYEWRENFISTFLERDLLLWAGFTPATMRRLWQMLAHLNGQTVNFSTLSVSLGIAASTVKTYIDLLASTYMVEVIPPFFSNLGKRLVKSPKLYVADSGITAALLSLRSFEDLSGHPAFGAIWEQIVLTNLKGWYPNAELFHYRTANGAKIDFVARIGRMVFALECKASFAPVLTKGNYLALGDIAPTHTFVVTPNDHGWPMSAEIDVVSLSELKVQLESRTGSAA